MQRKAHLDLAVDFLLSSVDPKTGGSAAFFSRIYKPLKGWSNPYPETTGYIIASLLDVYKIDPSQKAAEKAALKMADWVLELQDDEGALPGGLYNGNTDEKSIFNTAQMVIGLVAAFHHTGNKAYKDAAGAAGRWMAATQNENGSWNKHSFYKDFFPSYYTRVAWPMIMAGLECGDDDVVKAGRKCLDLIATKVLDNKFVADAGFKPDTFAFLHTIAYTIRGFIEAGLLLEDDKYYNIGYDLAHKLLRQFELKKKLAGAYFEDFKPVTWYRCLTGEAQMAIIWLRIFERNKDARFLSATSKLLDDTCKTQPKSNGLLIKKGGLKGSLPYYGTYLTFRQPNWATKFLIDAMLLEEKAFATVKNVVK